MNSCIEVSGENHHLAEIITVSRSMQVRALDEIIPRDICNSNVLSTTDRAKGQYKDDIMLSVKSLILHRTVPSKKEQATEKSEVR